MAKIVLYHGSQKIIEHPEYKAGKVQNDYGQGFYCTKHIELAKEWAADESKDGFVNSYELELNGLKVLNLNDDKYSILHWLTVLLEHRIVRVDGPISQDGLSYLKKNYHLDISDYDVIIGYRADDSYFSFARAFIANAISISQLEKAMYLGELGEQYFLQSEKAFEKIKFIEAISVDSSTYYPLKAARDIKARKDFTELTNSIDMNGTFILDLIRKDNGHGTSI